MAACASVNGPAVFIGRYDSDGLLSETFCLVGQRVRLYAEYPAFEAEAWATVEPEVLGPCDGTCGTPHDLNTVVSAALAKAKERRCRIRGFQAVRKFLATSEARQARLVDGFYAKRNSEGKEFCTGSTHFKVIWVSVPGTIATYGDVEFSTAPCDGFCKPQSKRF